MPRLKLTPRQASFVPPAGSRRPLRCVLVGGRAEYGNVRSIPDKLWKKWGIVVVRHLPPNVKSPPNPSTLDVDIAIVLVDVVSHMLSDWSKTLDVGHNIYVPSTWAKLDRALSDCGVSRVEGGLYSRPAPNGGHTEPVIVARPRQRPAPRPAPASRPAPPPWSAPASRSAPVAVDPAAPCGPPVVPGGPPVVPLVVPVTHPAPSALPPRLPAEALAAPTAPADLAAPSLSEVLRQLKVAMGAARIEHLLATLGPDGGLVVEIREIVVTNRTVRV